MSRPWTLTHRENRIRKYVRTQAWRHINVDRTRELRRNAYRRNSRQCIANTRRYELEHPGYKAAVDRRAVIGLSSHYIRQLVRKRVGHGVEITPEMMTATRQRVQAIRAQKTLRMLSIAYEIAR